MLWKQKSQECWLKKGDRNSKFLHLSTIIRRRRNNIDAIRNDVGVWILNTKEIGENFLDKFNDLFGEEGTNFPPDLENLIPNSISEDDATELCRIPTDQEIKDTLLSMPAQKAPVPDGRWASCAKQRILANSWGCRDKGRLKFFHFGKALKRGKPYMHCAHSKISKSHIF
jgi:hypothetical protein